MFFCERLLRAVAGSSTVLPVNFAIPVLFVCCRPSAPSRGLHSMLLYINLKETLENVLFCIVSGF